MSIGNSGKSSHFSQITSHIWVIHGSDKARFPSGNSIFIKTAHHSVLIDTNPGFDLINQAIGEITNQTAQNLTDILLSHTHLDHGRGLSATFELSNANISAHEDTLQRCESKRKIGLFAGIPKKKIPYFEEFGNSLGFQDRHYPASSKIKISNGDVLEFDNVKIQAHETSGHCPHMLDYEIIDGSTRIILSCDYDFSPMPWYGAPQRGSSIEIFLKGTSEIINRNPDYIISSHRIEPILPKYYLSEYAAFQRTISQRSERVVAFLSEKEISLAEIRNFVYPVDKMSGRYSDAYINLAIAWDAMLALCHLEFAWSLGWVECTDAGGDSFLEQSIQEDGPVKPSQIETIEKEWAIQTLAEEPPWEIPLESKWRRK